VCLYDNSSQSQSLENRRPFSITHPHHDQVLSWPTRYTPPMFTCFELLGCLRPSSRRKASWSMSASVSPSIPSLIDFSYSTSSDVSCTSLEAADSVSTGFGPSVSVAPDSEEPLSCVAAAGVCAVAARCTSSASVQVSRSALVSLKPTLSVAQSACSLAVSTKKCVSWIDFSESPASRSSSNFGSPVADILLEYSMSIRACAMCRASRRCHSMSRLVSRVSVTLCTFGSLLISKYFLVGTVSRI